MGITTYDEIISPYGREAHVTDDLLKPLANEGVETGHRGRRLFNDERTAWRILGDEDPTGRRKDSLELHLALFNLHWTMHADLVDPTTSVIEMSEEHWRDV